MSSYKTKEGSKSSHLRGRNQGIISILAWKSLLVSVPYMYGTRTTPFTFSLPTDHWKTINYCTVKNYFIYISGWRQNSLLSVINQTNSTTATHEFLYALSAWLCVNYYCFKHSSSCFMNAVFQRRRIGLQLCHVCLIYITSNPDKQLLADLKRENISLFKSRQLYLRWQVSKTNYAHVYFIFYICIYLDWLNRCREEKNNPQHNTTANNNKGNVFVNRNYVENLI